ncbi:MAG TPA: PVC-type heme-binding CxxCH protein [Fimbriiglobus sp.]|nr:PVC-type heme-binding CxxCH protein [Fimbriiglobus sp.]
MPRWLPTLVVPTALAALALAVPPDEQKPQTSTPNPDAEQAGKAAQVEKGLKVDLWAAEPLLANPVAFAFDEKGRCFVAETTRFGNGVPDTRNYMHWLDDDIGARSVADRLAMYERHSYKGYEKFDDQLRLVWDSDGRGKADRSTIFSGGYHRPEDGLAAGVLARKGDVYFTNIPDLYRLRDTNADGQADQKESLSTGYGVRAQFVGHDLHGLRMGPDGKLYFSVGDRGLNVTTKEGKKLFNPDSGAVLRCDPDGANLEIIHVGLRNPQELAFDDFGNLFTYDNNSDSGDRARWVQVVEGGDSGWRCGYQYGTLMHHKGVPQGNRGPWNAEKIWHVPGPDGEPPAYVVPPLLHFGNGPAGITYYPGVGLADRYKGHFFACDFTANPGNSVIWSLAVKPKGASFEVVDLHPFVKNMVPTDCEFGPDGAFYWSDWTGGWNPPGKGRIFRVTDAEALNNPAVGETKKLLAEGFEKRSEEELVKLLDHAHREVRQESQFELVRRATPNGSKDCERITAAMAKVAGGPNLLSRLHAVWVLGSLRKWENLLALAGDPDAEVRANVAKAIGGDYSHRPRLVKLLQDPDPRVRFHAALSYGKAGYLPSQDAKEALAQITPLFDLLKANDGQDAYLRHAAVNALAKTDKPCEIIDALKEGKEKYDTPAVRLGVVLALRKLQCRRLGEFLTDADPRVVAEAARAIHDQDLMTPMEDLAKLADKPGLPEPVAYRALSANFKLGKPEGAARLANFAARESEPGHLRECALKLLADWAKPPRRDPIVGTAMTLPERPAADAVSAVKPVLAKLFVGSDEVRAAAVKMTARLGVQDVGPVLTGLIADSKQPAGVRAEALFALEAVKAKELAEATKAALTSPEPRLRAAARVVKAKADPIAAARELPAVLNDAKAVAIEKQMALGVMGELKESKEIDVALAGWLDRYLAGKVSDELKLDVLEAAQERANARKLRLHAPLREKLKAIDQAARAAEKTDPLARYRESLSGGDGEKGRQIFLTSAAVYCQRCHKLDGQGGEVGPEVNGIGAKQTRDYLLEAITHPNAKIAEGYQSVILNTLDGKTISGVLRKKDDKAYTLVTADDKVIVVPRDDVDSEKPDKSAMPDDLHKKLSKRELRDVVEFLAGLKK